MSVEIISGEHWQCLMCNTSDTAFGGVFSYDEDVMNFLNYIQIDARRLSDSQFEVKQNEWRAIQQEINSKDIDFTLLQVDMEDVEPKDAPKYVDAFISKAFYRGVELNDEQLFWLNKQKQYVNRMANESLI